MKANMPARPDDLFDVRALLTDEERAVQEAVARFTDTRVVPAIGDAFDAGRFPREWIPDLAELERVMNFALVTLTYTDDAS